jgi:hypothetical protein
MRGDVILGAYDNVDNQHNNVKVGVANGFICNDLRVFALSQLINSAVTYRNKKFVSIIQILVFTVRNILTSHFIIFRNQTVHWSQTYKNNSHLRINHPSPRLIRGICSLPIFLFVSSVLVYKTKLWSAHDASSGNLHLSQPKRFRSVPPTTFSVHTSLCTHCQQWFGLQRFTRTTGRQLQR